MTNYSYSTQIKNSAKAVGRNLSISPKHSLETCRFIRGKNLQKAQQILHKVIKKETPVPYKRHHQDLGHKKGMAAGRYPVKACQEILKLLHSVESNAQDHGLNKESLIIAHISAQKASNQPRYGRHLGRTAKRTHIEVIVKESKKKETKKQKQSPTKETKETKKETQKGKKLKQKEEIQKNKTPQTEKTKPHKQNKKTEEKKKND